MRTLEARLFIFLFLIVSNSSVESIEMPDLVFGAHLTYSVVVTVFSICQCMTSNGKKKSSKKTEVKPQQSARSIYKNQTVEEVFIDSRQQLIPCEAASLNSSSFNVSADEEVKNEEVKTKQDSQISIQVHHYEQPYKTEEVKTKQESDLSIQVHRYAET